MFTKEMIAALHEDAEKLRHLTGGDHTPEFLLDCDTCGGEGQIEKPRPFPDDPYFCIVSDCPACNGVGFFVCEYQ